MLQSIEIQRFRGLERLRLEGLGRVNLLVGANNCGKSTVLEAIELLAGEHSYEPLSRVLIRRGEVVGAPGNPDLNVASLFLGFDATPGRSFVIRGDHGSFSEELHGMVRESSQPLYTRASVTSVDDVPTPFALELKRVGQPPLAPLLMTQDGIAPGDLARHFSHDVKRDGPGAVRGGGADDNIMNAVQQWDAISLTEHEDAIVEALGIIEPAIQRLASTAPSALDRGGKLTRSAFKVRLRETPNPVPLGSMGDGIWRMLSLALALVSARDGVLLVDEIDTGLHYSTLTQLWRLVLGVAERLNVQVFATTHSSDCWRALARCELARTPDVASLQRIDAGALVAVPFDLAELRIAADHEIEVR